MKKAVLITNIPAHYRIALFNRAYLKLMENGISLTVIFSRLSYKRRKYWDTDTMNFLFGYKILPVYNSFTIKNTLYEFGFSISKILKSLSPDTVIISGYSIRSLFAARYCIKNKIPYLIYSGETVYSAPNSSLRKKLRGYLLSKCYGAVVYGKKAKEYLSGLGINNIFTAINSIDTESFISELNRIILDVEFNPDKIKLLFVGELRAYKGLTYLFDALSLLSERNKNKYHLDIIGGGDGLPELIKYASSKHILNITFHGKVQYTDIAKFYVESDIFIFPSLIDNFGLVLVEGACAEMALLGSEFAGGSYDLIVNGYNGFIFNPKDRTEFSKKLEYLLDNPKEIKKLGENSRKIIDRDVNINKSADGFCTAIFNTIKNE